MPNRALKTHHNNLHIAFSPNLTSVSKTYRNNTVAFGNPREFEQALRTRENVLRECVPLFK